MAVKALLSGWFWERRRSLWPWAREPKRRSTATYCQIAASHEQPQLLAVLVARRQRLSKDSYIDSTSPVC